MKRIISVILSVLMIFSVTGVSALAGTTDGYQKMTGIIRAFMALINKEKIISTQYTGEVSTDAWNASDEYSLDNTVVLTKNKDKDFVILNITDIHFSDYDQRAWMAFPAAATVRRLVRTVKPDLITVTGDTVCGDSAVYSVARFTDLMTSFGIPWAPVFGNHEGDGNCDYNYIADIMLKSPTCLLKKGPADMGVGNYIINIAEKDGDNLNVVQSLIMMDTHKTHLWSNQIEWYKWAAKGISEAMGHDVESSVFFHIPCVEYQYAYDAAWDSDNDCWRDGYDASGELNEKICCHRDSDGNPVQNGFFAAVKETGTTKNIICGHEHMNDFSVMYEGVRLTYTLKVGLGSGFQAGFNGGTVIRVSDSGLTLKHMFTL